MSPDIDDIPDTLTDSVHDLELLYSGTRTPTQSGAQPHVAIMTDASATGWGATNLYTRRNARGYWREEERALPERVLELKAAYLALKIYCKYQDNVHMQVGFIYSSAKLFIDFVIHNYPSLTHLYHISIPQG